MKVMNASELSIIWISGQSTPESSNESWQKRNAFDSSLPSITFVTFFLQQG